MSSADVIDALFDRTVDIVQSLPKSGPIQTSYEEKLALYSLYKQATEGDVSSKRPGMLDMLARAKWDAWSKRQGMDPLDAKQLYVESMMRTLRKFQDRREARALIQELEAFSGDVAERVMRGALATDDTASEASSAAAAVPLRHLSHRQNTDSDEGEDEAHAQEMGDRLSSLRNSDLASIERRSTAARSTGGFSAQAQPPSVAGRDRIRHSLSARPPGNFTPGSTTPQWDDATIRTEEESDDGTFSAGRSHTESVLQREQEEETARMRAMRATGSSLRPIKPASGPNRYGQSAPTSSVGGGPHAAYAPQHPGTRPNVSNPGYYGATGPGGRQQPGPPRSESNLGGGGGAGASLYSAIGPSSRPPIEQHHYYHRPSGSEPARAPSSAGGGAPSMRGGSGQAEVEQALQSIQASLAALHERLNRVEVRSGSATRNTKVTGQGIYGSAYGAIKNALHDLGVLFGLASPSPSNGRGVDGSRSKITAPSFGASSNDRSGRGGAGAGASSSSSAPPNRSRLSSFLSFIVSLLNLSLRLALDLTSLGILITIFLFLVRKITGRGDPLVLLRMMRTLLGRRQASSGGTVRSGTAGGSGTGGGGRLVDGKALMVGIGAAAGGVVREVVNSVSNSTTTSVGGGGGGGGPGGGGSGGGDGIRGIPSEADVARRGKGSTISGRGSL